ncbi:hypothetical protein BO83DRAFT_66160 [Aspergillus eucalypticola CBS 122712]|uniref:Uncharacterized protein n=1 Tax=Aspergillus eucalypticola (strain CBS 122712 / IBT 29274) TaxID=1448314 RepID=A0A317V731_ASPEC|nr:uncharacterized protein BO83DRAFT_66160 [Aspergillus eucalypticola CBS 122712]PWY70153.1 hypothetical protein BO83DRAFT_66160 [Aspergillus eucalypticola CBS 122712]
MLSEKQKLPKKVSDRLRISARCDTYLPFFFSLPSAFLSRYDLFLTKHSSHRVEKFFQEIPCTEALESDVTTITIVSLCVFACASPLPSPSSLFDLFDLSSFSLDLGISSGDCYS